MRQFVDDFTKTAQSAGVTAGLEAFFVKLLNCALLFADEIALGRRSEVQSKDGDVTMLNECLHLGVVGNVQPWTSLGIGTARLGM